MVLPSWKLYQRELRRTTTHFPSAHEEMNSPVLIDIELQVVKPIFFKRAECETNRDTAQDRENTGHASILAD